VIGIVLPGMIIVVFLALSGDLRPEAPGVVVGHPLAMAIALPWHVVVALLHEDFAFMCR
jgi:hypothetical protein